MKNERLNLKYMSEVLGNVWECEKGTTIFAKGQTGVGKSTAILGNHKENIKGLIDHLEQGEKVIYLVNRNELKRELKLDLCSRYKIKIPMVKGEIDYNKLDKMSMFGNVTIMSYQTLSECVDKRERAKFDIYKQGKVDKIIEFEKSSFTLKHYRYIVCDEVHFIFSDSRFNGKTELVFNELIRRHYANSTKIFMTATDDCIKGVVDKAIEDISKELDLPQDKLFKRVSTGVDYSYLDVKYFKDKEDIITTITNTEDKWLWFVSKKADANTIKNKLKSYGVTCEVITAKNGSDTKATIRETNKFDCRVLLSTSVLDCGVNIKDEELTNVVIMCDDKDTFIQELGRKRININNPQRVNLYIPMGKGSSFRQRLKRLENERKESELFNKDKEAFEQKYDKNLGKISNIFYRDYDGNYKKSIIALSVKYRDMWFNERMWKSMKLDKFAFVKEQLSWLELEDTFDENNLISNVVSKKEVNKLEEFLEDCYKEDSLYTKEEFINEINTIIENDEKLNKLFTSLDGRNNRTKGQKKYNELLKEIGLNYIVVSKIKKKTIDGKRKNVTYWIVGIEE